MSFFDLFVTKLALVMPCELFNIIFIRAVQKFNKEHEFLKILEMFFVFFIKY